jgi:hypothetical protein
VPDEVVVGSPERRDDAEVDTSCRRFCVHDEAAPVVVEGFGRDRLLGAGLGRDHVVRLGLHPGHQRTDERKSEDLVRAPDGLASADVRAGGMADHVQRSVTDIRADERVDEIEDGRAPDRLVTGGPSHAGQIGIDPPVAAERHHDRLEAKAICSRFE